MIPNIKEKILIHNEAKCTQCNDILVSKHTHDFVTCSCKSLSVDGGLEYTKRNFSKPFEERSLYMLVEDLNYLKKTFPHNSSTEKQVSFILQFLNDKSLLLSSIEEIKVVIALNTDVSSQFNHKNFLGVLLVILRFLLKLEKLDITELRKSK